MPKDGSAKNQPLVVAYFGCDKPWAVIQNRAARRRNTAILEALAAHEFVARVLVFNYVLRSQLLRRLYASLSNRQTQVVDVFITNIFPEHWGAFWRRANRWLMSCMIWWQAGRLSGFRLVVWSYWPEGFKVAQRVALKGSWVFDADHDLVHDENQSAGKRADVEAVLAEVIQKADVIVAAARSALKWFEEHGARRVFRLRNGVALSRIQERNNVARGAKPIPRIGYVGVLSKWVDFELLMKLALARPDWKFIIGGTPYRAELPAGLRNIKNVEWIGDVPAEDLHAVLATFDVALGLNRRELWLDTDSMKLFDYLAAGVPVVTTRFHDHLDADFRGLLEFGETASEFASHIERILGRDEESHQGWNVRRRKFIEQNTWDMRADEAVRFLTELESAC